MQNVDVESRVADTLLDVGVGVLIPAPMFLRLFGKKTIKISVKQPYLGTSIRASRLYLKAQKMGITASNLSEAIEVREKTATIISRVVATFILRGKLSSWLFVKPLAWWLKNNVSEKILLSIVDVVITTGIEDFMITIRLTASLNLMTPNLSQK